MTRTLTALQSLLLTATLLLTANTYAAVYPMPKAGNDIVGRDFTVEAKRGDSLMKIARRYDMSLHEMLEANPRVRPTRLRAGQKIIVPSRFILPPYRKGIVINLPELRLYFFSPNGHEVFTYPVGVGRRQWRTPPTSTYVYKKQVYPDWNVPKSIKKHALRRGKVLPDVIPGGTPENPLGDYALYLGQKGILIHGTNNPNSIGKYVSSGCIRLHPRDIEQLYYMAQKGMRVRILNHSQKAGWLNGRLYLESHIPVRLNKAQKGKLNHDSYKDAIEAELKGPAHVDWRLAARVAKQRTGIPEPVGYRSTDMAPNSAGTAHRDARTTGPQNIRRHRR